jgi:predicted glutamine amidotransferase
MCLIIDRPPGKPIPDWLLTTGLSDNPDGWGIMFARKGELEVYRGMDPDDFFAVYDDVDEDAHLTVHFRWATHGTLDTRNCHPFTACDGEYAVMHNGVINTPIQDKTRSDTWHFVNGPLARTLEKVPRLFDHDKLRAVIERRVGVSNKLVVLRRDGARMFVNKSAGVEYRGLWMSNSSALWLENTARARRDDYTAYWESLEDEDTTDETFATRATKSTLVVRSVPPYRPSGNGPTLGYKGRLPGTGHATGRYNLRAK